MMTFLQCNLGKVWAAQALLHQFISENSIVICIISEQYANRTKASWLSSTSNTAAIWVLSPTLHSMSSRRNDGFIWVKFRDFTLISCYLSPNQGILTFRRQLGDLEDTIRRIDGEVIVAGDFSAKSTEWGIAWSDTRGNELADMVARLNLTTLNEDNVSTFRRPGCRESILDITFASPKTALAVRDWRVLEDYNFSDHQYIHFSTGNAPTNDTRHLFIRGQARNLHSSSKP